MKVEQKMKIGIVVDQLIAGGVQLAAIEQVKNLNQAGHRARLLILMRKKYPTDFSYLIKGIPYQYLSDSYPWPFRQTIKFPLFTFLSTLHLLSPFLAPRIIKKGAYDLLVSHGTTTCFTTLALWRQRQIPYLAVIHDPIVFILKKVYSKTPLKFLFPLFIPLSFRLEKAFVKDSLVTIIDSKVHQKFIKKNYQVDPFILPLGNRVAAKIPAKRGSFILAISRWQKEKNPAFLLKLLKEIPGTKLKLAGTWTQEAERQNFKDQVKKLNLQKRVEIIPQFTTVELEQLCRQARVWIHPHFEAFGLGGLEAAAQGVPIIIPAGSGVTDLFQHEIHGFFPKKTTIKEYKKYLQPLLKNERLAYQMGRKAWLEVKKESSWQAHTQKLLHLVKSQLTSFRFNQITVLELGHAGGTGLAGGDRLFEEMAKRMPEKFKIEVVTSLFGSHHWQKAQPKASLRVLRPSPFEEKPDPISVFRNYSIRIIKTSFLLLKQAQKLEIIYSSTNILPDILPAFIIKLKNPRITWVARIHHLVPLPHQRKGKLIVNLVSYLMQKLALFCIRTKANLTIALNETLYRHLLKIGFQPERLAVLGAGIDFDRISQHQPQKTESFAGVYLGRLHVAKGIFDTIEIWRQVVRKKKKAKLAIIGTGPEEIKKELTKEIKKNKLAKNIKILGYLPENKVYDYLKSAKIFLFTDHEAGWGLAVAEAMACRLPVIGYDIGILGDVFKQGFKTVKLGDTGNFAQTATRLLENENERKRLANEAFLQAKNLSWQKTTEKFVKIVREVL